METTEARRELIERLEAYARRHPGAYRARVTALALFGLGYRAFIGFVMFAMPVVVTLFIYPATWTLIIVVGVLLIFGLTWFGRGEVKGERITAADAPELFDALGALRRRIRAPRVHEVVLDREFNASAAQIPRLGIFGWHKQVLTLGVPLLAALSREQVLAVVGHELGHFSKAHGRLGHWIYRIRLSWEKLHAGVGEEDSGIGAAVAQFYGWFVPYFGAYSFALARLQEYEADADSALASDQAAAAGALVAVHVYGDWLEQAFWPRLRRLALEAPEPPADAFERLASELRGVPDDELHALQREALGRAADLVDTHPSLAERLLALGMPEVRAQAPATSAGEAFFGARWRGILERASKAWREADAQRWRDHHERVRAHSLRLEELLRQPEAERGLAGEIELARLSQEIDGAEAALERWRRLRAQVPDDPRVALHYGRALAALREPEAFEVLDALAGRDPCYAAPALAVLSRLALDLGDKARADRFDTRHAAALKRREAAATLFEDSFRDVTYDAHRLPPHALAVLTAQLQAGGMVAAAWVVTLKPSQETPFGVHLLIIRIDAEAMHKASADPTEIEERCRALLESVLEPSELAGARNFYTTEEMDPKVAAALAALPSARLFERPATAPASTSS